MIDKIILKFFGGIDTFTEWLFAWQKPRCKCKKKNEKDLSNNLWNINFSMDFFNNCNNGCLCWFYANKRIRF